MIFLSYASANEVEAKTLKAKLEKVGFEVGLHQSLLKQEIFMHVKSSKRFRLAMRLSYCSVKPPMHQNMWALKWNAPLTTKS